jgi:hypothetical protein
MCRLAHKPAELNLKPEETGQPSDRNYEWNTAFLAFQSWPGEMLAGAFDTADLPTLAKSQAFLLDANEAK